MAIEMVGGMYCPLSLRDPQQRLYALLQQTRSRLVLVHYLTKTKFQDDAISIDIDLLLVNNDIEDVVDVPRLSSVLVIPESVAYIIFTSGSTGIPKAVRNEFDKELVSCHCLILFIGSNSTSKCYSVYAFDGFH